MFKSIACVLALAAAVPAAAESRLVRYDDLNLSSPAGQDRLQRRIDSAARDVCGVASNNRLTLDMKAAANKCIADSKASANNQLAQLGTDAAKGG